MQRVPSAGNLQQVLKRAKTLQLLLKARENATDTDAYIHDWREKNHVCSDWLDHS